MKDTEIIVMYDSPEAAKPYTMDGWASRNGHFFKDEDMARYDGCTHKLCDCGNIMKKYYTKCDNCREKKRQETYESLQFKEWDGDTPLVIWQDDTYFFSEDEIADYCIDNEVNSVDLQLVICEPNYLHEIDSDIWEYELSEDQELPDELLLLIGKVNDYVKNNMINWIPSDIRTTIKIDID